MLLTVSGLLVVLIGLRMWGVPFLRRISPELTRPCRFRGKAFAAGLLTGLMPCGALSSMWIFAASSGSWASGAASMLAFGAGTCVFMLLFGLTIVCMVWMHYAIKQQRRLDGRAQTADVDLSPLTSSQS